MKTSLWSLTILSMVALVACGGDDATGEGPKEAIVDGRVDVEGLYPHVVLVGQGCTGTLISPVHVLTAAHCICEAQETPRRIGSSKPLWQV
jgi:V8-like Glu-specific endopeptidase